MSEPRPAPEVGAEEVGEAGLRLVPPAPRVEPADGLPELLSKLPPYVQDAALEHEDGLEEIVMRLNRPLKVWANGVQHGRDTVVTDDDLEYVRHRIGKLRADNRAGIEGTLHRISLLPDVQGRALGFTIRVARVVTGSAEKLRPLLHRCRGGLMLIGPPAVGKTTVLRDVVRILAQQHGSRVLVVDTSQEIGGDGRNAHPCLGDATRFPVPRTDRQAEAIREAVANHSAVWVVVDEVGYHGDAQVIETTARRGVKVVATAHGETLQDVIENPHLWPLVGNLHDGRRRGRPVFGAAVEVHGRGDLRCHEDVAAAVDRALLGDYPHAVRL